MGGICSGARRWHLLYRRGYATPEARAVRCDVALLPIGGTYTMDAEEAADLARAIRPRVVVPTHYSHAAAARQFRQLLEGVVPCQILLENL